MAVVVLFFSKGKKRAHIPPHNLGYIRILARIWPKTRILTTPAINGRTRTLPHYPVDRMYPRYAFLMSPHPKPSSEEQPRFRCLQEAMRKDVLRLFGVLVKRFHVALHPGRYHSVTQHVTTHKAI